MNEPLSEIIAIMIPIVAIVMGIGMGMLAVMLDYRKKRDMFALHHKERLAAIEKGMEVPPLPPEFFQSGRKSYTPAALLRRGLTLLLVGGAIMVALYQSSNRSYLWGLVPVAIGIAQLLSYYIESRKAPRE